MQRYQPHEMRQILGLWFEVVCRRKIVMRKMRKAEVDVVLKPVMLGAMTLLEAQVLGYMPSIGMWALGPPLQSLERAASSGDVVVLQLCHNSLIGEPSMRLHSKAQAVLRDAVDVQLAHEFQLTALGLGRMPCRESRKGFIGCKPMAESLKNRIGHDGTNPALRTRGRACEKDHFLQPRHLADDNGSS